MLTTREVAERIGVKYPTVMLWLRENKLAGAVKESSPRGEYWLIPESSIAGIKKRGQGRPKKTETNQAGTDQTEEGAADVAEAIAKPKRRKTAKKARKRT